MFRNLLGRYFWRLLCDIRESRFQQKTGHLGPWDGYISTFWAAWVD
jgi:hypothetical protein